MKYLHMQPSVSKRLKYVVSLRRSRVDYSEEERPYVGLENVESWTGRFITDSSGRDCTAQEKGGGSLCSTFEPGDVLFGKLRPYLAKVWVADFSGRCTTEFLVMQPLEVIAPFLRYVCLCREFVDKVDASTFGSKMPRADWDFIGNMTIRVPVADHQRAIVEFLDRETSRIDGLITAKQRVLNLLAEKKKAIIASAVVRGLNPSAPLRDSGVPWLGMVPAHWSVARSKRLFSLRNERAPNGLQALTASQEHGVIPQEEFMEREGRRVVQVETGTDILKLVQRNDFVISMRSFQGGILNGHIKSGQLWTVQNRPVGAGTG